MPYKSLQEVFAHFGSPKIMYKPMIRQLRSKSTIFTPEKDFQDTVKFFISLLLMFGQQMRP